MRIFGWVFCLSLGKAFAQKMDVHTYIARYGQLAIAEQWRTGVPAAIKLAQGIHESGAGTGSLALRSNNHFGIKCKSSWTGSRVYHDDDEKGECFRAYDSVAQSYRDHSDFLRANSRYAALFELSPNDYKGWAQGLKKAGYATNPRYPLLLIKIIEEYQLQDLTAWALLHSDSRRTWHPAGYLTTQDNEALQEDKGRPETIPDPSTLLSSPPIRQSLGQPDVDANDNFALLPGTVFRFANTRAIIAPAGSSLLALAQEFGLALRDLLAWNGLESSMVLERDQLILLERRRYKASTSHTVAPGETWWLIAQGYQISPERLAAINGLPLESALRPGQKLWLSEPHPSAANR